MFSYIKGLLVEVADEDITVETMGIGWKIFVPASTLDRLPRTGEDVKIFISFQVKEDGITLYGFLENQDRQMFDMLLRVNGVGPKAAMGILSVLTPADLRMAILSEDAKAIAKAPGIGPKTAKRVILDLKDRVRMEDFMPSGIDANFGREAVRAMDETADAAKEAVAALVALGYSLSEATHAVRRVAEKDGQTPEEILKASLKHLAF